MVLSTHIQNKYNKLFYLNVLVSMSTETCIFVQGNEVLGSWSRKKLAPHQIRRAQVCTVKTQRTCMNHLGGQKTQEATLSQAIQFSGMC